MSFAANSSNPLPVIKTDTLGIFCAYALSSSLIAASSFSNGTTRYFGDILLKCSSNSALFLSQLTTTTYILLDSLFICSIKLSKTGVNY